MSEVRCSWVESIEVKDEMILNFHMMFLYIFIYFNDILCYNFFIINIFVIINYESIIE